MSAVLFKASPYAFNYLHNNFSVVLHQSNRSSVVHEENPEEIVIPPSPK